MEVKEDAKSIFLTTNGKNLIIDSLEELLMLKQMFKLATFYNTNIKHITKNQNKKSIF